MKKAFFIAGVLAVFSLVACQINNIHDAGGTVAPVSTVTGLKLGGTGYDNP
ncbi:colicin release lysis protein [Citrobacter portucalensis]|uniref:colicin release lysis protein n=1 Tax=Citrobacter portucalensis TaxID=1639133 RepID=UPI003CF829BD